MKRILSIAAMILMLSSTSVMACGSPQDPCDGPAEYDSDSGWARTKNDQTQFQTDGATGNAKTMFGGAAQVEFQSGMGAASEGNKASSELHQEQGEVGQVAFDNGKGDFTSQAWEATQVQDGKGQTTGGEYVFANKQGQIGGAVAFTDGVGKNSFAGSAYLGGGSSFSQADANSTAAASQKQEFNGGYSVLNQGKNGYIYQAGDQSAVIQTATQAGNGQASANAIGVQAGGSYANNNGKATYMSSGTDAIGYGSVNVMNTPCADASGSVVLKQTHNYEQSVVSPDATAFQYQSGKSSTTVKAKVD